MKKSILKPILLALFAFNFSCQKEEIKEIVESPNSVQKPERTRVAASQTIGVNYNGLLENANKDELSRTGTVWARGFLSPDAFTQEKIDGFNNLKAWGYKTILSIKWDYAGVSFPTTAAGYTA